MSISGLIETAGSQFGPRFNLLGILPSFVLVIFIFFMIFSWNEKPSVIPNIGALVNAVGALTLQQGIIIAVAVIVFSLIIHPLQLPLVRILEGYWGNNKLAEFLSERAKSIQRGRLRELTRVDINEGLSEQEISRIKRRMALRRPYRIQRYPNERRLLPTSLGNVLRAAEDMAGQRYGLSTITIWPRLYPLLSDNVKSIVNDQRNQLDIAARFCVIFIITSTISFVFYLAILYRASLTDLPLAVILSNPSLIDVPFMHIHLWVGLAIKYGLWLILPLSALFLSWLSYLGAKSVAVSYGIGIQSAFDLHRFDLLKNLHLQLPDDLNSERKANHQLSDFLRDYSRLGINANFQYVHEDKDHENKKTGSPFP
jgi:hypothetical protein